MPDVSADSVNTLHQLNHEFMWFVAFIIAPMFLLTLLREFVVDIVAGVLWRYRSGYENDEIVNIDGEWARIAHMGYIRTRFTVYQWDGPIHRAPPIGGMTMSVLNSELRRCRIKQQMEMVEQPPTINNNNNTEG